MDLFLHNPSLPLLCICLLWTTGAVNCTQCPTDCKCYKDTSTVLCVEGKHSILPQSLPESTQALFVFKNRITNISSESFFKLPQLITLDLSHNYIERITDRTFSPLYGLKNLDLSYNHLHIISIHAFQGLVSLERLYLHNNKLGRCELGNVYQMPRLLELKLHDNHLQIIERIQTPNLLLLDLSRNRISKLSPGTLKQLDLEFLYLSGNRLKDLQGNVFGKMGKLHSLDLSGNRLVNIPMVVQSVSKLTQLNISNNPLRCPLRKDTLEMLTVIKVLDVRKTILSEISRCFVPNASSLRPTSYRFCCRSWFWFSTQCLWPKSHLSLTNQHHFSKTKAIPFIVHAGYSPSTELKIPQLNTSSREMPLGHSGGENPETNLTCTLVKVSKPILFATGLCLAGSLFLMLIMQFGIFFVDQIR